MTGTIFALIFCTTIGTTPNPTIICHKSPGGQFETLEECKAYKAKTSHLYNPDQELSCVSKSVPVWSKAD